MNEKIKNIITNYLLEGTDINKIYEKIYNGEIYDTTTKKNLKGIYSNWNEEGKNFQIDLPYWYNKIDKNRPTIMIIGTDANNSETEDKEKLVLSAPYHSQDKKDKNIYNQILKKITNDCNIYLTDIFKLFFRFCKQINNTKISVKSHQMPTYRYSNVHYDILKQEINYIHPDLIVTFGDFAKNAVSIVSEKEIIFKETISKDNILTHKQGKGYEFVLNKKNIKFAPILHPSGEARPNHWKNFLSANNLENKLANLEGNKRVNATVKIIQELIEK